MTESNAAARNNKINLNSPDPFRGGGGGGGEEKELMNVEGLMWMRGEQLKSAPRSFSLQIQREKRETEIVSGTEEEEEEEEEKSGKKNPILSQSEKPILKAE